METSPLVSIINQMSGFYKKQNTGSRQVKKAVVVLSYIGTTFNSFCEGVFFIILTLSMQLSYMVLPLLNL